MHLSSIFPAKASSNNKYGFLISCRGLPVPPLKNCTTSAKILNAISSAVLEPNFLYFFISL